MAHELRCLLRDSKTVYLSIVGGVIAPLLLHWPNRKIESLSLVPLLPAFALSVVGPNQLGLDGLGFARFILAPQSLRTVLMAKHAILAGAFLVNTASVIVILMLRGVIEPAQIVPTVGLAAIALFLFLAVGVTFSWVRPAPIPTGMSGSLGFVDSWLGQMIVFVATAMPSLAFWLAQTILDGLTVVFSVGLFVGVISLAACFWWLTLRAAAGAIARNAMTIQMRLMP